MSYASWGAPHLLKPWLLSAQMPIAILAYTFGLYLVSWQRTPKILGISEVIGDFLYANELT